MVRWNGDVVARATLTDQQGTVAWTIAGDVGDNLLSIEAALDAPNPIVGMSMPNVPVGVAVGEIRFTAP